jgi:hypothetical protein
MHADRSQQLVVSSRELLKEPEPLKDAPFLEGIECQDVTPQQTHPGLVDLRETWMGNGEAVYRGVKLCSKVVLGIVFYALLAHAVGIDTLGAAGTLLRACW